ncbi:hypothetical protein GCM10010423_17720 [Streptomyces levis]|uniref:Uncharacterized protein n=1 Tax=Streptomyces levis TaxID=285566 RepID=A0ABP6AVH9_9ACTN
MPLSRTPVVQLAGCCAPCKRSRYRIRGGEIMKKAYEAPTLVRLGTFRKKTGLLQRSGNDRLILSKN